MNLKELTHNEKDEKILYLEGRCEFIHLLCDNLLHNVELYLSRMPGGDRKLVHESFIDNVKTTRGLLDSVDDE